MNLTSAQKVTLAAHIRANTNIITVESDSTVAINPIGTSSSDSYYLLSR